MLVLSRRPNEKIVFPNLGIHIDVVRVAGKVVKLGIEAPADVPILRGELLGSGEQTFQPAPQAANRDSERTGITSEQRHALRNRLNKAMLGLQVVQASIEQGQTEDLEDLIYKIFQNLSDLNTELDASLAQDCSSQNAAEKKTAMALIVEDNANEAQLMSQYLRLHGYRTDVVNNGREAIAWLQQNEHPDLVLMDMNMPEMDGATTVRSIRQNPNFNHIRLFGVSGLEQEETGLESGQDGVDCWFTKPVDARRLVEAIRRKQDDQPLTPCA